jgi:hypothetical protein
MQGLTYRRLPQPISFNRFTSSRRRPRKAKAVDLNPALKMAFDNNLINKRTSLDHNFAFAIPQPIFVQIPDDNFLTTQVLRIPIVDIAEDNLDAEAVNPSGLEKKILRRKMIATPVSCGMAKNNNATQYDYNSFQRTNLTLDHSQL